LRNKNRTKKGALLCSFCAFYHRFLYLAAAAACCFATFGL